MHMNLFNTGGNLWRAVRNRFSPMFTTGKLRFMFPQVSGIGEGFMDLLNTKNEKVDMVDYFGKFAMEVIGATAFGLEGRAMEENSEFREKGKKIFEPSFSNFMRFTLGPSLLRALGVPPTPKEMLQYFGPAVKNALKYRRENGVIRHDFIQHMVTLQQKGSIEVDKDDVSDEILMMDHVPEMKVEMSDELMIGQSMGFMVAGFDATALSMGWLCYELARHPDIQSKARQEVKEVMEKHGNRLDYDTVREMKFLSYCLKENGRLHSALDSNFRMVTKPYKVPDTSAVLERGAFVYIPILSVHMDPKFYPEPERFLPERWGPENDRPSCTYLPFGTGPRMCIAMRFANMEMMCAISKLLMNFEVSLHPSVRLPPRIEPFSFFTYPREKIYFNLKKISP
uniref:Putative cytochrome P450 6a14 n=1 Tax=Lygus hesperus TaxID=30085 RepID=A0A0A9YR56_LYGHE